MSDLRFYSGFDFVVFGEVALLELGEDQFTIDTQFELSSCSRYQSEPFDVRLVIGEDFCRQTDGL